MPLNGHGTGYALLFETAVSPITAAPESPSTILAENSDPHDCYTYRCSQVIYQGRTPFQEIAIADTCNYGRALFLDGCIQSAEADEALYHEMLVQPAMLGHPDPRDVLIIGAGEGAALREVLAHRSVRSVTMVDVDQAVVKLCQEHLGSLHRGAFAEPRARLVFEDGRAFVERTRDQYDVVIIDVVDMFDNGPAQALYMQQFYQALRHRLRSGGIVAIQGLEFSTLDSQPHAVLSRTLRTVFREVHSYRVAIPSFLCSWGFLVASDVLRPSSWSAVAIDREIAHRLADAGVLHVNGEFLKGCFALCKETRRLLSQPGPILEDGVEIDFSVLELALEKPVDGPSPFYRRGGS